MSVELVSRPFAAALLRHVAAHSEVLVLSADLTSSCEVNGIRDAYPDRFLSMGMTEQHMISFAAGLAREGFRPWLATFAVFLTRRVFDQVAMSIGYPNLPVRLVGFLPGLTTPGGVTHQAIDDVGLMRLIPNLTIIDCGDATEVETSLGAAEAVNGPVYLRMLRGQVPRLFPADEPLVVGRARDLGAAGEVLVLSSGICTEETLRALAALGERGVHVAHLHVSTLKPFDDPRVFGAMATARRGIVTVENHLVTGGLGTCVAERLAERGRGIPLVRLGLNDTYAHGASKAYLLKEYGLDALAIARAVEGLLDLHGGVNEADLAAVRLEAVHSRHKAEGL